MSKISELSDGGSLVSTDYLIAVRSGGNVKVQMDTINVDQVDLGDNEFIRLGNSQDLTLVHTSTQSIINQAGVGDLLLQKGGATKLTVNSSGIDVTGAVTASGEVFIAEKLTHTGDTDTHFKFAGANDIRIVAGNVEHAAFDGTIVFNQSGSSTMDFRVESDTQEHMIFVDASANRVGIANNAPTSALDITGTATMDGLTVDGAADIDYQSGATNNTAPDTLKVSNKTTGVHAAGLGASIKFEHTNSSASYSGSKISNVSNADPFTSNLSFYPYNYGYKEAMRISSNGDISFYEDTGTTPKFFWDAAAESLGIGTSSPVRPLSVKASQEQLTLSEGDTRGATFDYRSSTGNLNIATNGINARTNPQFTLDLSGNVGIGTSSPSTRLTVGGGVSSEAIKVNAGSGWADLRLNSSASNGGSIYWNDGADSGQIFYYHPDDSMRFHTAATERMRIDSSGRVGIGTSSPDTTTMLTVAGAATFTGQNTGHGASRLKIGQDSTAISQIRFYGADTSTAGILQFMGSSSDGSVGTERMRIDSSGNVGIGVAPSYTFDVSAASAVAMVRTPDTTSPTLGLFVNAGSNGVGTISVDDGGHMTFDTGANGAGQAERMRIDSSGNLLVGKSATDFGVAGSRLSQAGEMQGTVSGSAVAAFNRLSNFGEIATFWKDTSQVGSISTHNSRLAIGSDDTYIMFDSGSTPSLWPSSGTAALDDTIAIGDPSYRFTDLYLSGIANAPQVSVSPYTGLFNAGTNKIGFQINGQQKAQIDSSGNLLVGCTSEASASVTGLSVNNAGYINTSRGTTGLAGHHQFINPNGIVGIITTSGTATSYTTSSDQRLKENIADADDAGSKVDAIQVRKFDWKADGSHQDYGMVAQELLEVAPEAVSAPEDPEEMMGVDYSKLVPMMLKEIQSLRARVAQLES